MATCLSCTANTYLSNGTCNICPGNEINPSGNSNSSCSCPANMYLNNTYCYSCSTGYYAVNNSCVPDCRNISGCVTCGSPGFCQTCNPVYTIANNGGCILCNISYCLACSQYMSCDSCSNYLQGINCQILCLISNCQSCSSNNTCTKCIAPFTLINSISCFCDPPFMLVNGSCQCDVNVYSYIPHGPNCLPNCVVAYCLACSNSTCSLCI